MTIKRMKRRAKRQKGAEWTTRLFETDELIDQRATTSKDRKELFRRDLIRATLDSRHVVREAAEEAEAPPRKDREVVTTEAEGREYPDPMSDDEVW